LDLKINNKRPNSHIAIALDGICRYVLSSVADGVRWL